MNIFDIITGICAGLAAAIPLVIQLVKYIKEAAKEKNWQKMLSILQELIVEAEDDPSLESGEARKAWVMQKIQKLAIAVGYPINMNEISELIDSLVALTKRVNVQG